MPLWSFPGVVTDTPIQGRFAAELDLGMRWHHPLTLLVAGLSPRRGSPADRKLAGLLTPGTRFTAVCERIDTTDPVRAHILLIDGTDVASAVRGRAQTVPAWTYGCGFDKQWHYPATLQRLTDADTAVCRLDVGVRSAPVAYVRVAHVNAPEHGTTTGDAATVWAEQILLAGMSVDVTSHELDRYGRVLGSLTLPDHQDYAALLLQAGHAVPYEGGAR